MFGKQGKSEINWPLLILVVIVVLIAFPAIPEKLSGLFGLTPAPTPSTPSTPAVAGCYIEDTTMTLTSEEMFNPSTTPGGDHKVWINGHDQGLVANSGSLTVSPGDAYKILWVSNSTTHYGKVTEGVVPCSGTLKLHEKLYQWDVGRAATTAAVVTNDDGILNSAANLTLSLGEVTSVGVQVRAAFEDAIGNPEVENPNILACMYNLSVLDKLDIAGFTATDVPSLASPTAGMKWQAWKVPSIVSNENKLEFDMTIDADETYAIVSTYTNQIVCYLYDSDYDIDGNTGEIIFGVEDEADNNLGLTTGSINFTIGMAP